MGVTQADNEQLYYPQGLVDTDFIGFSFNGVTSESLGIIRTSDGSRYDEQMIPNFQDVSAQMPGSDYTLYWESFYNTRTWNINIAFDHMTDAQMRLFRQKFNTKVMGKLQFAEFDNNDIEYPNGVYWLAKVQAPPQLKYICFEENGSRIYKGEGSISFIAYYPFGMSNFERKDYISNNQIITSHTIQNKGDIPMNWLMMLNQSNYPNLGSIVCGDNHLNFANGFTRSDAYIVINSKTNLIEGASDIHLSTGKYDPTGNVYNEFITSGDFFQIPVTDENGIAFQILPKNQSSFESIGQPPHLFYNYLYL